MRIEDPSKCSPPRWAVRLLEWYCAPHLLEEVQGDLQEEFDYQVVCMGHRKAKLDYVRNVIGFIRFSTLKRKRPECSSPLINYSMLRHYFIIAFRSLWNNKIYSFVNVSGLSVGIAVSVLILLFVAHEFRYDHFHKNIERIYRVEKQFSGGRYSLWSSPEFGPMIKENNARGVNYVRLFTPGRRVVKSDQDHRFMEDNFIFADTSFFSIFSFDLIQGNRSSLARSNTVIVTDRMAKKYFGEADAMGKILVYDKDHSFEVVGIARNVPSNSMIHFDFVASFISILSIPSQRVHLLNNESGFPTFLLLRDKAALAEVEATIRKSDYTNADVAYMLKPFSDAHFNLNFGDASNTQYVYVFLFIAILILALALVNYINLTTARATVRAKEVGVRKVIGARPLSLSAQFYLESTITLVLSFGLALVLVEIFIPYFLNILQEDIDMSFIRSPLVIGLLVALVLICIILSGSYPAMVLSRVKPVEVMRGKMSDTDGGARIRKVFIVFQFSVSATLIICSLVVQHQLDYLRNKKLGLQKEQVMVIPMDDSMAKSYYGIKSGIRSLSGITTVGAASAALFKGGMGGGRTESPVTHENADVQWIRVDDHFLEALDIAWKEKPEGNTLTGNHLINEATIDAFNMGDRHTGYPFSMGGDHTPVFKGEIVGVVKDFNYKTLRSKIEPLILTIQSDSARIMDDGGGSLYVRLTPSARLNEEIASIKKVYEQYESEIPFTYYFLDDAFDQLYKGEDRLAKIFSVFTGVAISIACLGLFGLVTFTTERRTKEFGIRKVLGASARNILLLLSGELTLLLVISIALAAPFAWLAMKSWLSHFSYRVEIPVWYPIAAGVSILLIAFITVSFQALKSALANPVDSLRSE